MVRQHVDLETIETRVERGIYSSCHLNFYRDLLLLFNNAIVFFPKSSLESSTAHQLGRLVSIELNRDSSQETQLQTSDSLLVKDKQRNSTAPILVCRKRSSVSAKPSSTSDDKTLLKLKEQEKAIITGTRSLRRNTNNNKNPTTNNNNKKQEKQEASKRDTKKKKTEASAADKKKSVVDFLQRIKKNSPSTVQSQSAKKEEPKRNTSGKKAGKESGEKKENNVNVGRPPTAKRAREVVVAKPKRQSKRARR